MAKKDEDQTEAVRMERTGEKEFAVEHDDGSVFHCEADSRERAEHIQTGLRKVKCKPPVPRRYWGGLDFDKNGKIIDKRSKS